MEELRKVTVEEATTQAKCLFESCDRFTKDFLKWLYEKTDYFTAPASSNSHSNCVGGLVVHSFKVYLRLREFNQLYKFEIPEDSLRIMGLMHDLCKTNFYKSEKRNRKNAETKKWEEYDAFAIDDQFPLDHGHKSVILLRPLNLNQKEMLAIAWHLGAWHVSDYGRTQCLAEAMKKCNWCLALQFADQMAMFYDEA